MARNTDRAGIFGDSFVDLNVKASRGRHGAERADPPTPGGSGVEGGHPSEETARKYRGGRDPPTKNGSEKAEDHNGYIYFIPGIYVRTRYHIYT